MKLVLRFLFVACLASLSFAAANAEENPNQLFTALGSTTISGYVDVSAHWMATPEPLPGDAQSFPIVFVTGPGIVREGSNPITGAARHFQFTVHRLGRSTNEITVYLNFHSPGTPPAQGGVTIPAGAWKATSTWFLPDNGLRDGARAFTASISAAPVRLQMPGARYKLSPQWPQSSTVVILDAKNRDR